MSTIYSSITERTPEALAERLSEWHAAGWKPIGSPFPAQIGVATVGLSMILAREAPTPAATKPTRKRKATAKPKSLLATVKEAGAEARKEVEDAIVAINASAAALNTPTPKRKQKAGEK